MIYFYILYENFKNVFYSHVPAPSPFGNHQLVLHSYVSGDGE